MKKKKTKAKGKQDHSIANSQISQRKKDKTRRRTKTQKKITKKEKELRKKLRKKIKEERRKLEERRKFLSEINKLHKSSNDIKLTETNYRLLIDLSKKDLPFEIIKIILKETDKYNEIKEIFESFNFKKKLISLRELIENLYNINIDYLKEILENLNTNNNIEDLENKIKLFEENLKNFDTETEAEILKKLLEEQKDLLTTIIKTIGNLYESVEGMLDNNYSDLEAEIFNALEKFYTDFYQEDYENNY